MRRKEAADGIRRLALYYCVRGLPKNIEIESEQTVQSLWSKSASKADTVEGLVRSCPFAVERLQGDIRALPRASANYAVVSVDGTGRIFSGRL